MRAVSSPDDKNDDFAAMLADFEPAKRGSGPKIGQMVTGTVVNIGTNTVFLDLGGKSEGAIERELPQSGNRFDGVGRYDVERGQ